MRKLIAMVAVAAISVGGCSLFVEKQEDFKNLAGACIAIQDLGNDTVKVEIVFGPPAQDGTRTAHVDVKRVDLSQHKPARPVGDVGPAGAGLAGAAPAGDPVACGNGRCEVSGQRGGEACAGGSCSAGSGRRSGGGSGWWLGKNLGRPRPW